MENTEIYNPNDKDSVLLHAKKLIGKTLRQIYDTEIRNHHFVGKGTLGQLIEKYHFKYSPNSNPIADFSEIGIELKTSPIKRKSDKVYVAKERLVLNIINYLDIPNQSFEKSDFWKKNAHLLLIFYLYEPNIDVIDYLIRIVNDWQYSSIDLEIIRRDWEFIKAKIKQGKAHELSEGDTFYLGACTKGANASTKRPQPNNTIPAKQRAYSLKMGYVNHILATITHDYVDNYGKIITNTDILKHKSIENIVLGKFEPYYNLSIKEISNKTNSILNPKAKNYYASITKLILGIELNKDIEEFKKAEIITKTVRLDENYFPLQHVSFPAFKFKELVNEDWEDSEFKDILEHKFFFVFYQKVGDELILKRVKFWNMPFKDISQAKLVWDKTREILNNGDILKSNEGGNRKTYFPSTKFNSVAHVRPHANDSEEEYELPFPDKLTNSKSYTKQSFWLNKQYIRNEIYLK
jgi:DNA mismatch repair protein MutH